MDLYDVDITPFAYSQLDDYISYIQYTLLNPVAAESVWKDALETANELERCAGSLPLCSHPELRKLGYHPFVFLKHNYVMLYRVIGKTASVEAIYHLMQDYEHVFLQTI